MAGTMDTYSSVLAPAVSWVCAHCEASAVPGSADFSAIERLSRRNSPNSLGVKNMLPWPAGQLHHPGSRCRP